MNKIKLSSGLTSTVNNLKNVMIMVLISASILNAGDSKEMKEKDPKAQLQSGMGEPEVKESRIYGDFGVAVANMYISRGLVLVDKGFVIQPYLNLNINAYKGDGFINSVTPFIGVWANVNSDSSFTDGSGMSNWYEFDYMPGVSIGFAKRFKYTFTYLEFISPSGAFQTAVSLNNSIAFDDAGLIDKSGNFSFQPSFTVLNELDAGGAAGMLKDAMYFEFALGPNYTVMKESKYPVNLSIPINIGLGDDKFYNGDTFGYFSIGLGAAVPLAFIPKEYGDWSASLVYKHYVLGEQASSFDRGDKSQDVISAQVACKF